MSRRKKRIIFWSSVVLGATLLWSTVVAIAITYEGRSNPDATGDVAIVLGAAVWTDKPSPVFQARIDHAILLFEKGQVGHLLFTGGLADGDELSEAEAAKRYAVERGVPESAILMEEESRTTHENLSNAKREMKRRGLRSAVIVSDPFHMLRAGMLADRIEMEHVESPTETSRYKGIGTQGEQVVREVYFVSRVLITGK
jgi:uncharacterized SAM-binding protein YcdF (DUF218 family)